MEGTQTSRAGSGEPPPRPGDVVFLGREASPQFAGGPGVRVKIIRSGMWETYHGWTWIHGYQLDSGGAAVCRRTLFVWLEGIRYLRRATPRATYAVEGRTGRSRGCTPGSAGPAREAAPCA